MIFILYFLFWSELTWQLRQQCEARQVPNVRYALQHNIGLGGAVVVGLYRIGFPDQFKKIAPGSANPAVDAEAIQTRSLSPAAAASGNLMAKL